MFFSHILLKTPTFQQTTILSSLTSWENCLDENAHNALRGVPAAHYAEAQALLSGPLLVDDGVVG